MEDLDFVTLEAQALCLQLYGVPIDMFAKVYVKHDTTSFWFYNCLNGNYSIWVGSKLNTPEQIATVIGRCMFYRFTRKMPVRGATRD